MRKKIILLFVVITLSITPCFANMPVIDVTAIAQAVTSYVQTITEWKTQLKQWKSEFDRLQKASEDLAKGCCVFDKANVNLESQLYAL